MHIAICDDNIAERKQTERLMKREADKLIASGDTLYMDSYGNVEALLGTPMQYDGFLVDFRNTENFSSIEVLHALRSKGVTAPVCIVYPRDDESYWDKKSPADYPAETLFLGKPLRPAELHETILKLKRISQNTVPSIELRGERETFYVAEDEIISVRQKGTKSLVKLTENREVLIGYDAYSLFEEIRHGHECFVMPNLASMINLSYVDHIRLNFIHLTNGERFRCHRKVLNYVRAYTKGEL